MSVTSIVHPIHFEDYEGKQFERLVFAYHLRSAEWQFIDWYGQVGSDSGRDIWGVKKKDNQQTEGICIQCVNRKVLVSTKATRDIDKVLKSPHGKPDIFRLVCAGPISAKVRDKIKLHASKAGISVCEIWSGEEFEEKLRASCEPLLKRFVDGEIFPETTGDLKVFVRTAVEMNDGEIVELIGRTLDRSAFRTPFHQESNLPLFKQAITDTIRVLNTGIWQTTEGKEIGRIPSRHFVKDEKVRAALESIERQLVNLRTRFDSLMKEGKIKHCQCNVPDCPTYFFTREACQEMDELRSKILVQFRQLHPRFSAHIGPVD